MLCAPCPFFDFLTFILFNLPDRFSTDEGQCWSIYTFTNEPISFTGLASEPGARSMNVSIWGYKDSLITQNWVSFTIDFRELLTRDCKSCNKRDYS